MRGSDFYKNIKNKFFACLGLYERNPDKKLNPDILNDIDSSPDIDTIQVLHDDLKSTHVETLNGFSDLSNKNARLLQFTGTVFAVVAAAASVVDDLNDYVNKLTISGLSLLVISILILLYVSKTSSVESGPGRKVFREAIGVGSTGKPLDELTYRIWVCKKYTDWIDTASKQNRTKACRLRLAEILTITGLAFLSSGIFISAL